MAGDLYAILGVPRSASADEIKRAYRQKARELHPDTNPDDPETGEHFKELSRAYQVLSDPDQRARYDRFGDAGIGGAGGGADGGLRRRARRPLRRLLRRWRQPVRWRSGAVRADRHAARTWRSSPIWRSSRRCSARRSRSR